jgi:hypothetical protein
MPVCSLWSSFTFDPALRLGRIRTFRIECRAGPAHRPDPIFSKVRVEACPGFQPWFLASHHSTALCYI